MRVGLTRTSNHQARASEKVASSTSPLTMSIHELGGLVGNRGTLCGRDASMREDALKAILNSGCHDGRSPASPCNIPCYC